MKMSLCNTFRFFAVSVVLVVSINNANAFSFRRTTTIRGARDLFADETRVTDIKDNTKRPNFNQTLNTYKNNVTASSIATTDVNLREGGQTFTNHKNKISSKISKIPIKNDTSITSHIMKATVKTVPKKKSLQSAVSRATERTISPRTNLSDEATNNASTKELRDTNKNTTTHKKETHLQNKNILPKSISNTETIIPLINEKIIKEINEKLLKSTIYNNAEATTLPPWKKYTFIHRNRLPVEDTAINTKNKDIEIDAPEIIHSASSLKDTITSDIPSLEKLKNDLLSSTTNIKNINKNDRNFKLVGQQPDTAKSDQIKINNSKNIINEDSKWSVESKRAGFLDYTEKNKELGITDDTTLGDTLSTVDSIYNDRTQYFNQESPGLQAKDFIKETLLNESDSVGNKGKESEEGINKEFEPSPAQISNLLNIEKQNLEDKLQSKPISVEKTKNSSLYTVSPNYKPLKKLEVQPPKPFIRDPDDNSWRNESISSLGIVFKPKNSSKPFTQVLKNKTETEWNSLLEKERKNDIPDLRERLEQMAKMRKTKRKKIDSMGNVVYVDYEENSNSNENSGSSENITPLQDDIMIPLLNFDPQFLLTASKFPVTMSPEEPEVTTYTTTSEISNNKETTTVQARKPKKNFNIPDYYESSEDEELDYLDLAKIDIKKYVQKTTQTPFVPSTWSTLSYKTTKSELPERKATVQYFPPLTTKKAKQNKYNDPMNQNIPISTYKPTTNVAPVSYPETGIPANNKFSQYDADAHDEIPVTNKPTTIDTDIYLSQRIDEPINRYKVISDEGNLNRGSYVIKSYDDFINEAEKDDNFDRNIEYGPYTEASVQSVTANKVIKEERIKDELNFNEDLDYDTKFRKDVISRFVENFNRNSERFKSGFPIIFNSSIVHETHGDGREVASSRAFLRGLHGEAAPRHNNYNPYQPNRENVTVELSPTYEFHYFVPEQEEKEEVSHVTPLRYKL